MSEDPIAGPAFHLDLSAAGVHDADTVSVTRARVSEALLKPAEATIDFVVQESLYPDAVLGRPAVLTLTNGGEPRYFLGVVTDLTATSKSNMRFGYRAMLRHPIWMLSLNRASRVFAQASTSDILRRVIREVGLAEGADVKIQLREQHPPHVCVLQYEESDLSFITRILEEQGGYYYTDIYADDQPIVLADESTPPPILDVGSLEFRIQSGMTPKYERITSFRFTKRVTSARVRLRDYRFEQPDPMPEYTTHDADTHPRASGEQFCFINQGHEPDEVSALAEQNLDRCRLDHAVVQGTSTCPRLAPGYVFTLDDQTGADLNGDYRVIEVEHEGSEPQSAGEYSSGGSGEQYVNHFVAIPSNIPYRRPPQTLEPRIYGTHTATVVGPTAGEPHVDQYGRVQVRFHWQSDFRIETAPWVRVAQPWAGGRFGFLAIPRVGHEVVLAFLDGNPNRPLITGSVYNGTAIPPQDLPLLKANTSLRSSSLGNKPGSNEITMDDTAGEERLYLKAQHNFIEEIGNDQSSKVKRDVERIVGRDLKISIDGKSARLVTGSDDLEANEITLTATSKITIQCGASQIVLSPSSMTIDAPLVKINC